MPTTTIAKPETVMPTSDHDAPAPYAAGAPWPVMRGDLRNSGRRPITPILDPTTAPWRFRTGNSIFSTPVIGADETLYVGSADHRFYALDPLGRAERWRFQAREVIDSAACLGQDGTIFVPTGDACVYALDPSGQERWRFDALTERPGYSPTTLSWWEGNVTLGPDGTIYGGCDDFYIYALDPRTGRLRWGTPTGMHIWTAPGFGIDGSVLAASFDMHLYALDPDSGAVRWRTNLKNFVSSSPAVDHDGTIYCGAFDGHLHAIDPHGRRLWSVATGGPIYASAALSGDGRLYIGSMDGCLYAIDPATRSVAWSFYTGDPIRGSATLGPDPEERAPYLIYLGGGDGRIHALEPSGARRWSYDTARDLGPGECPNVNASIALGRRGIATATAAGDVVWIPYDHYLRAEEEYERAPGDGYPAEGRSFHPVSLGGRPEPTPLPATDGPTREVAPHAPVVVRLVERSAGQTVPAKIDLARVTVVADPPVALRTISVSDGAHLAIVPEEPLREPVRIEVSARTAGLPIEGSVRLAPRSRGAPTAPQPFRIRRMSLPAPAIVATFDQIGIASLHIDVNVLEVDASTGAAIAWGLQQFGVDAEGDKVAVEAPRTYTFAFGGTCRDGELILEGGPALFEITAFPLPIERIRFAASLDADGIPSLDGSMLVEARNPSLWTWLELLRHGNPTRFRLWDLPRALLVALRGFPMAWRLLRGQAHRPWNLVDADGRFASPGTFLAEASPPPTRSKLQLDRVRARGRTFTASFRPEEQTGHPGLLLVDTTTQRPLPIDPNTARVRRDRQGRVTSASISIPRRLAFDPARTEVFILSDTEPLGRRPWRG